MILLAAIFLSLGIHLLIEYPTPKVSVVETNLSLPVICLTIYLVGLFVVGFIARKNNFISKPFSG